MNILIHIWNLSKHRGSEFSVSYNYLKSMERSHKLYVTIASTSYEREDYSELEELKAEFPNCEFITVEPNLYMNIWKKLERKIPAYLLNISKYGYYKQWEKQLYRKVKKSDFYANIDLIHYVGPAGYHEPGYLYKLEKPYIWGATSGFENINKELAKRLFASKKFLLLKSLLNTIAIKFNIRLKKVIKHSDIIIAATNSNRELIAKNFKHRNKIMYFPENLMRINEEKILSKEFIKNKFSNIQTLNIIWIGNIEPRKMPNLFIDSLRLVKSKRIRVNIIGGGYSIIRKQCDLEFVNFIDRIPREMVDDYWNQAHIHVITSALEANTTVLFEAMEHCVPTITTDICGMKDIVKDNTGFKIPINNYDQVCAQLAQIIDNIATNPSILLPMAFSLREDSYNYVAHKREDFYNNLYNSFN